jgi:hypothetical protein
MNDPEDMCTDCQSRRGFLGWILKVTAALGLGGATYMQVTKPGEAHFRPGTKEELLGHIEQWATDSFIVEGDDTVYQPFTVVGDRTQEFWDAIRTKDLGYFHNFEVAVYPEGTVHADGTCTVTQQFCVWCPNVNNPRRCQRDYRCYSAANGWHNHAIQMTCPSCPCPPIR